MSATLTPTPKQQYVDQNGVPMAGGWLFSYIAGTSTPLPTYTDASGSSANPNPVPLDSAGRAAIWLGSSAYKLVLQDASFNTVWTVDNVQTDLGALATAGASTGSALVGFLQAGTGAVARTAQDKMRELISVKDFGAKGDGSTDDTAAIQRCLDYAQTFTAGIGCEVVFPNGQYNYSALFISNGNVSLRGEGKVLLVKTSGTGTGLLISGASGTIYGISLSNLYFSCNVHQVSGTTLYLNNLSQTSLEGITFTNFPFVNYRGMQIQSCHSTFMSEIVAEDCLEIGIGMTDCVDVFMSHGRSDANGLHGWFFDHCAGIYFNDVTTYSNGGSGFYMQDVAAGVVSGGNCFYHMMACIGDTSNSHNWTIQNVTDSEFTNCWGSYQKTQVADFYGFAINSGCKNLEFNHCQALTNTGPGMGILPGATNITVTGGQFLSNGRVAGSAQRYGIYCAGDTVRILGANCMDELTPKTQQYGVQIAGGTSIMVKNCNLVGNAVGGILVGSLPTNFIEEDNFPGATGSNVASAATLPIPINGDIFFVTGTTGITAISNPYVGRKITLIFTGVLTVTDGGTLKIAGNFTSTGLYSTLTLISPDGANWAEVSRAVN